MYLVFEKSTKNKDRYTILDESGMISGSVYVPKGHKIEDTMTLTVIAAGHPDHSELLSSALGQ